MSSFVNPLPGVPDVESPLFDSLFAAKQVPPQTVDIARRLRRDGFVVIDFPDPDFHKMADSVINTLNGRYDWKGWHEGTNNNLRVQDAWKDVPEVKSIACNPTLLQLLSDLYGRRVFPFQTLNFPVGTQQGVHTDSVHFSSYPERFMVGVWVALEDIDSDNGPLIYYPGSHSLPLFTNEHVGAVPDPIEPAAHYGLYGQAWAQIIETLGLKPLEFHARKGQALIWAANLLHGGAPQKDRARTRYSQVSHYFFEGCTYYTPLFSSPFLNNIYVRDLVDISTGQQVPNTVCGRYLDGDGTRPEPVPITGPQTLPPGFDASAYLRANPDVAAAKADPAQHWLKCGYKEGRPLR